MKRNSETKKLNQKTLSSLSLLPVENINTDTDPLKFLQLSETSTPQKTTAYSHFDSDDDGGNGDSAVADDCCSLFSFCCYI